MTRYEEIMDRIVVTQDMRDRILTNIDRQMNNRRHHRRKTRPATTWLPLLAAAAVLLVVCGVTYGNLAGRSESGSTSSSNVAMATDQGEIETTLESQGVDPAEGTDPVGAVSASKEDQSLQESADTDSAVTADYYAPESYDSAAALSEAVGFTVNDLSSIPFTVVETDYVALDAEFAQISYYDANGDDLTYRKSIGIDDNSGDYNIYDVTQEVAVAGCTVTCKGETDTFHLAVWTDGTYAYSIYLTDGCIMEQLQTLIAESME